MKCSRSCLIVRIDTPLSYLHHFYTEMCGGFEMGLSSIEMFCTIFIPQLNRKYSGTGCRWTEMKGKYAKLEQGWQNWNKGVTEGKRGAIDFFVRVRVGVNLPLQDYCDLWSVESKFLPIYTSSCYVSCSKFITKTLFKIDLVEVQCIPNVFLH